MIERERFGPIEYAPLPPQSDDRADSFIDLARPDVGTYSSLRAYWEVLSKHRWEVLATLLSVLSIVAIYSFKMKPVYRATVRLEIEAGASQIQSLNDLDR